MGQYIANGDGNVPLHGPNTDGVDLPYHTNAAGYCVLDKTYKDPNNRRIRVVTIGAGYSGILLAYRIPRELENVEHVIYEKNGDIGGAWLENRYPNCACDVPSHSYVFPFALNPEWPEYYSKSESIWEYLDRVCRVWNLRECMKFNHRVSEAVWHEDVGKWHLKIEKIYIDGAVEEITDTCDVLLQAAGLLNNPILPKIEGYEKFKGRIVHTAQWPSDYGAEQWKNETVAVVGAGASAVQTVPGMQPYAKALHVFVRSKTWLASAGSEADIDVWPAEKRKEFREHPEELVAEARKMEVQVNVMWKSMFKADPLQKLARETAAQKMREIIGRDDLADGFIPDFGYGCRRVSPGIKMMKAVSQPNVTCHFSPVVRITDHSVIAANGDELRCDTIVFATGFDTTFRPHYRLIGQDGVSLAEKWKDVPEGYLGVGVPGFPNFLTFFGPAWPVFAGSVTASLTAVAALAIKMIRKIQTDDICSIAPKQDVTDQFNVHQQTMLHGTVWEDDCSSWYKDKNGRIVAIWPGSGLHFQEVVSEPRWEDWNIKYMNKHNMFAFFGLGFTRRERDPDSDKAPYMSLEAIDKEWLNDDIPWHVDFIPNKETARLATAEHAPETLNRSNSLRKAQLLDSTGPDGDRSVTFAGATLVDNEEIGQVLK